MLGSFSVKTLNSKLVEVFQVLFNAKACNFNTIIVKYPEQVFNVIIAAISARF